MSHYAYTAANNVGYPERTTRDTLTYPQMIQRAAMFARDALDRAPFAESVTMRVWRVTDAGTYLMPPIHELTMTRGD